MHKDIRFHAVQDVAELFTCRMAELLAENGMTHQYDAEPEPVENDRAPGFIPFTSGGFTLCVAQTFNAEENGQPGPIRQIIRESLKDACENAMRNQGLQTPGGFDGLEAWEAYNACYELFDDQSDEQDQFCGDVDAWFSEDCYFWKANALFFAPGQIGNETGECEVYFDAYLNTDLNYGRDYVGWLGCYGTDPDRTTGPWRKTITVAKLTRLAARFGAERIAEALASRAFASLQSL